MQEICNKYTHNQQLIRVFHEKKKINITYNSSGFPETLFRLTDFISCKKISTTHIIRLVFQRHSSGWQICLPLRNYSNYLHIICVAFPKHCSGWKDLS